MSELVRNRHGPLRPVLRRGDANRLSATPALKTGRRLQAFADGGFNVPTAQPAAPVFSFSAPSSDVPSSVSFNNTFGNISNPSKAVDEMMFAYRTKIRGGR